MDGVQLLRLGKRLVDLARDVTVQAGESSLTPGEIAVLETVLRYPDSSVGEIHVRTGFVQSHVSVSVARLRERGLIEITPDPADRRRTRARLTEPARQAILARARRPADDAITRAVGDAEQGRRATLLLDELAQILLPLPDAEPSPRPPSAASTAD
jgi:DNA-binding MarR family transcriptional regulator